MIGFLFIVAFDIVGSYICLILFAAFLCYRAIDCLLQNNQHLRRSLKESSLMRNVVRVCDDKPFAEANLMKRRICQIVASSTGNVLGFG